MHAALTFGSVRLQAYVAVPGRAGEGRRVAEALRAAEPLFVAAEVDPAHALAIRQTVAGARAELPFLPRLMAAETAARHSGEDADIFLPAARYAREVDVPFVPLLPPERAPGFFQRRRLRKLAAATPSHGEESEFLRGLEAAVRAEPDIGASRREGDLAASRALADLLFRRGATRVAVVLTAARAARILEHLRALAPPSRVPAEVTEAEAYPAYR